MWPALHVSRHSFIYPCLTFLKGSWVVNKSTIGYVLYFDIFGGHKITLIREIIQLFDHFPIAVYKTLLLSEIKILLKRSRPSRSKFYFFMKNRVFLCILNDQNLNVRSQVIRGIQRSYICLNIIWGKELLLVFPWQNDTWQTRYTNFFVFTNNIINGKEHRLIETNTNKPHMTRALFAKQRILNSEYCL